MLIFLITSLGFASFSIDVLSPHSRCNLTGTLILTSVNFRWIVTSRLPPVSYLTFYDKFSIGCLLHLVLFSVWHALIGSQLINSSSVSAANIDKYFMYSAMGFFVFFMFFFIFGVLKLDYKKRKFYEENKKTRYNCN